MIATKLDVTDHAKIQKVGLAALENALGGVTDAIRFLEQFDNGGSGDYTAEKYLAEGHESFAEKIRRLIGF